MKTQQFNTIFLIAVLSLGSIATRAEQVKKMHKSWPVDKVTTLAVENKYGNISFINNRDDSVVIDVSIETDINSHRSNRLAEEIDFSFSLNDGKAKAKTIFSNNFSSKQNFNINYVINIPTNKNLEVCNKYGSVSVGDLNATGNFEIAYGSISANSLLAPNNQNIRLDLRYGNANIENINHFVGNISYSKLRANSIDEADLETRYSTLFTEDCKEIFANSRYDNFTLTNVGRIKTDSKFTNWNVDVATTSAEFVTEYGDIKIRKVPANFEKINVDNRYGNIRIGIAEGAGYLLKSETFYCNVLFPDAKTNKYIKDNNHTIIEAVIGTKNSHSKVNIESHYGKVDLME